MGTSFNKGVRVKAKVYVGGTFDMFHWGHASFLRSIKKYFRDKTKCSLPLQGCHLIASVNGDAFCQQYKRKPVMGQYERGAVVSSCKWVDEVMIMPSRELQKQCILEVSPDYIVMGSDWKDKDYFSQLTINQEILDSITCKMLFIDYTKGISTTDIIHRILNLNVL